MKRAVSVILFLLTFTWPVNFYHENQNKSFIPHTIFESDYQAQQVVLRNINLYPNIPLARFFQNKAVVIANKYFSNLFSLIDPNYYFFASHPREVINGQNYFRLSLFLIIPLFWFIFKTKYPPKKIVLATTLTTIMFLSFFTNYYQYDLVLWPLFAFMIVSSL